MTRTQLSLLPFEALALICRAVEAIGERIEPIVTRWANETGGDE